MTHFTDSNTDWQQSTLCKICKENFNKQLKISKPQLHTYNEQCYLHLTDGLKQPHTHKFNGIPKIHKVHTLHALTTYHLAVLISPFSQCSVSQQCSSTSYMHISRLPAQLNFSFYHSTRSFCARWCHTGISGCREPLPLHTPVWMLYPSLNAWMQY